MTKPRHLLWDYLDACGIEFRLTKKQLIKKYGHRNCGWTSNLDYCEVNSETPFIEGLAHPIVFQFQPSDDLELCPTSLTGYVRKFDTCEENFNFALAQLTKAFGPGADSSASNTKARTWNFTSTKQDWRFGDASLDITIFPVSLNARGNARHKMIAGSRTECSITIETAYARAPSPKERQWLKTYERYYTPPDDTARSVHFITGLTRAWPDDLPQPVLSFGFSQDGLALIAMRRAGKVDILPTVLITSVERHSLTPAKGSGGSFLSVDYNTQDGKPKTFTLASTYASHTAYKSLAERLSQKLGVALEFYEEPDC